MTIIDIGCYLMISGLLLAICAIGVSAGRWLRSSFPLVPIADQPVAGPDAAAEPELEPDPDDEPAPASPASPYRAPVTPPPTTERTLSAMERLRQAAKDRADATVRREEATREAEAAAREKLAEVRVWFPASDTEPRVTHDDDMIQITHDGRTLRIRCYPDAGDGRPCAGIHGIVEPGGNYFRATNWSGQWTINTCTGSMLNAGGYFTEATMADAVIRLLGLGEGGKARD